MISENKLDSFPQTQFFMSDFSKPYSVSRDNKEGEILLYIGEGSISRSILNS